MYVNSENVLLYIYLLQYWLRRADTATTPARVRAHRAGTRDSGGEIAIFYARLGLRS